MTERPAHQLDMVGLSAEHMGLVAWNADGTGPEPFVEPRSFETPIGTITHHVYASTPDYDGIDPASPGGFKVTGISGFDSLQRALAELDADLGHITLSIGLMTESDFHHDEHHLETRTMAIDDPLIIRFDGRPALHLPARRARNTIDWNVTDFDDSVHHSESEPALPALAPDAHGAAKVVGDAMIADAKGGAMATEFSDLAIDHDTQWEGIGRLQGIRAGLKSARLWVVP